MDIFNSKPFRVPADADGVIRQTITPDDDGCWSAVLVSILPGSPTYVRVDLLELGDDPNDPPAASTVLSMDEVAELIDALQVALDPEKRPIGF